MLQLGTQSEKFTLVYKYDKGYNVGMGDTNLDIIMINDSLRIYSIISNMFKFYEFECIYNLMYKDKYFKLSRTHCKNEKAEFLNGMKLNFVAVN